jgi:DNA-binding transcriptional MerR regulator
LLVRWDVDGLARTCGLSVDTVRYSQSIGLLHAPAREGRRAFYDQSHVDRIERVLSLSNRGFSLKAIAALIEEGDIEASDRLLLGAVEAETEAARFTSEQLAERTGVPREILAVVEAAGLIDSDPDAERGASYTAADLRAARAAIKLIRHGFPLTRLVKLALKHDRAMRSTIDEAIDLFDERVRKKGAAAEEDPEAVARAFRELLPAVTAVVAHHFQRTLVNRALARLKKSGERRAYRAALEAAGRGGRKSGADLKKRA